MARNETVQGQIPLENPSQRTSEQQPDPAQIAGIRDARRVLVLGSSGSGKTHLAVRLGEALGLDIIHLDAHFWRPDSKPSADEEWRESVSKLSQRESWIMDGTYERSLDLRVPRADAIIMLECPPDRCLDRVKKRQQSSKNQARPDLPDGYVEQLDENHTTYVKHYPEVTRPAVLASIERYRPDALVVTLAAPEAIDPFLTELRQRETASA